MLNAMVSEFKAYLPRIVGDKVMMPTDLRRNSPRAERAEARPAKATYRQSCCRTFGDGHLAREGAVEHPLHAVPEGGVASTGGGPMKTPKAMGPEKPGIVAVTVLLAVAITDTVLSFRFAT